MEFDQTQSDQVGSHEKIEKQKQKQSFIDLYRSF